MQNGTRTELLLRSLLDSRTIGVAFADPTGSISQASPAFLEMTGRSAAELRAGAISWSAIALPGEGGDSLPAPGGALNVDLIRKDGVRVPVLALRESTGPKVPGGPDSVLIVLDLTRLSGSRSPGECEASTGDREEFLADLSHALRTPLQSILGWTALLRAGKLGPDEVAPALEVIEANVRAQAKLLDDLQDLTRLRRGRLRLDMKEIDLARVLDDAVRSVQPAAGAKGIRIESHIPGRTLIRGDAERLRQVFLGLLHNSIQFTPQGGRVQSRLVLEPSGVRVLVEDSGVGIPSDLLQGLFRATGARRGRRGRLGIGLSIARRLVELHGGTLAAESGGEGKGATFIVTLPLEAPSMAGPEEPEAEAPGDPETVEVEAGALRSAPEPVHREVPRAPAVKETPRPPLLHGLQVLVVDDEADARRLLSTVLRHHGAEVTAASSAAEAMKALSTAGSGGRLPDVLVCDIGMPEESGYDLIHKVRILRPERGGSIPALALTAYSSAVDRMRALAAGFQNHLAKPIDPEELSEAIASLAHRPIEESPRRGFIP